MTTPKLRKYQSYFLFLFFSLSILITNLIHSYVRGCSSMECNFVCNISINLGGKNFCIVDVEPDSHGYIIPWLYWKSHGIYWDDYRTPIYGLFYFLAHSLSEVLAPLIVYVLQLVLLSIAYTYLVFLTTGWTRIIVSLLLIVLPLSFYYPRILLTESLTGAFLIIGAVSFIRGRYLLAGMAFALSAMLKPVFFAVLFGSALYFLFTRSFKNAVRFVILYGLFPLLIVGSWALRNYNIYRELRFMHGSGTALSPVLLSDDLVQARLSFQMSTGLMGFQIHNECFRVPPWIMKAVSYSEEDLRFLLFYANPTKCEDRLIIARKILKAEYEVRNYYGYSLHFMRMFEVFSSLLPTKSNGYFCSKPSYSIYSLFYLSIFFLSFVGFFCDDRVRFLSFVALMGICGYAFLGTGGYRYWEPIVPLMITSSTMVLQRLRLSKVYFWTK